MIPPKEGIIKTDLGTDINVINEWSYENSEESKQEIATDIIIEPTNDRVTQIVGQEDQAENDLVDIHHTHRPIAKLPSPLFSATSVNCAGYGLSGNEDGNIDTGVVRRASLIFATAGDLSFDSSELQDSQEIP
eukprot:CAMPEP_0198253996 /NCGR_PEP_ID=MMETSP1447-20131203/4381_1 /TAXON_ID=420782 /ORGANISM="Chaetoceros dichaeta, Strain CCMP1751" /LENGTH=132 /DNA_ID=CAMNT_0043939895 /DNA_START=167 /DNA_END=565 /DNA_ORIENTATION=+